MTLPGYWDYGGMSIEACGFREGGDGVVASSFAGRLSCVILCRDMFVP